MFHFPCLCVFVCVCMCVCMRVCAHACVCVSSSFCKYMIVKSSMLICAVCLHQVVTDLAVLPQGDYDDC